MWRRLKDPPLHIKIDSGLYFVYDHGQDSAIFYRGLMSEYVCLQCGKELEYDWAPCPNCGWKPPEPWEITQEDEEFYEEKITLDKPRPWVQITTWLLLALGLLGLILFLAR